VKATITERGQVSIPARLRREMHLEPGQTVLWEKVSATECRLVVVEDEKIAPDPLGALSFARAHGWTWALPDAYLQALREGESDHLAGVLDLGRLPRRPSTLGGAREEKTRWASE
jgi:AbrB family looped-hinge helix DNA binding protein